MIWHRWRTTYADATSHRLVIACIPRLARLRYCRERPQCGAPIRGPAQPARVPSGLCEVAAISEHEHMPEMAAAALANYLLTQPHGGETIRTMIIDDIHKALDEGRVGHAVELFMALRHFLEQHPEGRAGLHHCY